MEARRKINKINSFDISLLEGIRRILWSGSKRHFRPVWKKRI